MSKHKLYVSIIAGALVLGGIGVFVWMGGFLDINKNKTDITDDTGSNEQVIPYTQSDEEIESVADPNERYQRYVNKAYDLQYAGLEEAYLYYVKAYEVAEADVSLESREEMIYMAYKDAESKGFSNQATKLKSMLGDDKVQKIESYLSELGGEYQ